MRRRLVVVFAPDCTDARVVKRMRAFMASGFDLLGVSYRRARYNRDYQPEWDNINLAEIKDRRYARRLLVLARSAVRVWRSRNRFRHASLWYWAWC